MYRPPAHRYGSHHGYLSVDWHLDWFDRAFGRSERFRLGVRTADSGLRFEEQWLSAAGFDWSAWEAATRIARPPTPPKTDPLPRRVAWALADDAYNTNETASDPRGPLAPAANSRGGATYGEEEEAEYVREMLDRAPASADIDYQSFSFGGYISGT